jgi:three-Cys-motif partner protein
MVRGVASREKWALKPYHYFEMYAGPGIYTTQYQSLFGDSGSPLIAAGVLRKHRYRMYLNDEDPGVVTALATSLAYESVHAQISNMDARAFTDLICDETWRQREYDCTDCKAMGLLFADPNGVPDWQAIIQVANCPQYDRLDLLVNVNATTIKRCHSVHTSAKGHRRLREHLADLGKKYLYVWAPHKSNFWQFALVFATNWDKFPEFSKSQFYRSDSPEGRAILDKLHYTREEIKHGKAG